MTKPKSQISGQLALPFGGEPEPEEIGDWADGGGDWADPSLPSGGDSVIRWRQIQ